MRLIGGSRGARVTAVAAVFSLAGGGCAFDGLSFRQDDRLEITSPEDESVVKEPVVITWTIEDFDVTGPTTTASPDAGYFGVFIDRFPQPPAESLSWLVRDDEACQRSPRCPSRAYYEDLGIFTTTETEFTLPVLPRPPESETAEIHHVNIVLLDGLGNRIGESVWIVDFELDREDA